MPLKSILGALFLISLAVVGFWWQQQQGKTDTTPAFPELEDVLARFEADGVESAGPEACLECHREEVENWQHSHHALANDPLEEADIERFREKPEGARAERGIQWKIRQGQPYLSEPGVGTSPTVGKIGFTPLVQYLQLMEDGRLQALDLSWDPHEEEWFSVFDSEAGPPRQPGEWGHWTGQGMNWDANCAYCHMTHFEKNYQAKEDRYLRHWDQMGIACSQCHPGMDVHLAQSRNGNTYWKEALTDEQVMESCAICHSRREELTPHQFRAGDDFEDHFNLTLASIPGIYHPDGQIIGENYVYGSFTMSRMGHAGVTCLDCHDPHTTKTILPVENNALCMRCHGSGLDDAPKINPTAHSHHQPDSTGNRCVECHMPETTFMARDDRRDHSFSHPDPRLTLELGIPNACSQCHQDKPTRWALDHAEEWYGEDMNADRRAKARLTRRAYDRDDSSAQPLLEKLQAEENRFWKASLASLFQYLRPGETTLEALEPLTRDEDPLVRAAAVRTLGQLGVDTGNIPGAKRDDARIVRIAAVLNSETPPAFNSALESEYVAYLKHNADSPMGALRLSAWYEIRNNREDAIFYTGRAIELEPGNTEVYRQAAIRLHSLGQSSRAKELLESGLRMEPENALLHFNLGLLGAETEDRSLAFRHLRRATELEPQNENAWYNLIVLYWQAGNMETVDNLLREGLTHLPQSRRLRDLESQRTLQRGP